MSFQYHSLEPFQVFFSLKKKKKKVLSLGVSHTCADQYSADYSRGPSAEICTSLCAALPAQDPALGTLATQRPWTLSSLSSTQGVPAGPAWVPLLCSLETLTRWGAWRLSPGGDPGQSWALLIPCPSLEDGPSSSDVSALEAITS